KSRNHTQFQMPLMLHRSFAESSSSCCNQADDRRVESLENALKIRQLMKTVVRNGEGNHHQKRRQYEAHHRRDCTSQPSQLESHIRDCVCGISPGQTLSQRHGVKELLFRKPTVLSHDNTANLANYGYAAAEPCEAQLQKGAAQGLPWDRGPGGLRLREA